MEELPLFQAPRIAGRLAVCEANLLNDSNSLERRLSQPRAYHSSTQRLVGKSHRTDSHVSGRRTAQPLRSFLLAGSGSVSGPLKLHNAVVTTTIPWVTLASYLWKRPFPCSLFPDSGSYHASSRALSGDLRSWNSSHSLRPCRQKVFGPRHPF